MSPIMKPSDEGNELLKKIYAKIEQEQKEVGGCTPGSASQSPQVQISEADIYKSATSQQDGDSWLFCQIYRNQLCYDHAAGRWYEWKGHYWEEDKVDNVTRKIDKVIDIYSKEAGELARKISEIDKNGNMKDIPPLEKKEKEYNKKISQLQKRRWKEDVLKLAASGDGSLGISGEGWDKDPWVLGCKNGVIELKTGDIRPGKPDEYIRAFCPTEWKGINEPSPIWDDSLLQIFEKDTILIPFVQRIFGYGITAEKKREHMFPILEGPDGQNGKGTILEAVFEVMGPLLSGPIEAEMLLDQGRAKSSTGPSADIMDLRGKRIIWASETNEGRKFNIGKVKWLTGGDTLKGRTPFAKNGVSFRVTHTLFLITNHRPKADPNDSPFWKRVFLIPFHVSFVSDPQQPNERKADFELPEKLKTETSGILAWLVRGCLEWQKHGLMPPDVVKIATQTYQEDEDVLGHFIDDSCFLGADKKVKAIDFYNAYTKWCEENGHKAMNSTNFGRRMSLKFENERDRSGKYYFGVGLSQDPPWV